MSDVTHTISHTINIILHTINQCIELLRHNLWYIFLLIMTLYFVKHQFHNFKKYYISGHTLGSSSAKNITATSKQNRSSHVNNELYQIRLRQQEQLNQQTLEAHRLRQEQQQQQHNTNNDTIKSSDTTKIKSKQIKKKVTTKSSSTTTLSSGYNPMQPWTSSSGGSSYRPTRRTTNRG